jgi:hypothetical protein
MHGSAASLALAAALLSPLVEGGKLHPGWRVVTLPQQSKPVTQYTAETIDGREAVRVQAQASYGNLVHEPAPAEPAHYLSWAWRLQQGNPAADLRTKAGDDAAIKVCLSFDLPLEQVPFMDRQVLRWARARVAEPLPAATLCWVWAGAEAKGSLLPNAFTRRLRYIVLRNEQDATSTWLEERRDVAADFRRAFGDEATTVPPVIAVIVAGDADNTGASTLAHLSGLRWQP